MGNKIQVNNQLIADLSRLAKLKFDNDTIKKMKSDLNTMLNFVDCISSIDTKNVAPLIHISNEKNIFRNDKISPSVSQKEALKNAPQKDSDYFKVPTVLKK